MLFRSDEQKHRSVAVPPERGPDHPARSSGSSRPSGEGPTDARRYMKHAINIWQQLGFSFDSISAGFLANEKQVEIIEELIYMNRAIDPFVVVDPIMGDNGKLYNGIDPERISTMASLCKHGNIVTPNMTEALMLTGCTENLPDKLTMTDCRTLINDFRKIAGLAGYPRHHPLAAHGGGLKLSFCR